MSSVFSLPPLLFVTFREMYGVSYTLLGTLVLVNFCTQLSIDLIFTFFSRYFNIRKTIRFMPLLTSVGLFLYALAPMLFPQHVYAGLLSGTVLFSVAAGLSEVLLSPVVAALPSDNPERDMSMLHSLYAWGVVGVIAVSTLFFNLFGARNWMYLTMLLAVLPLVASFFFCTSPIPDLNLTQPDSAGSIKKHITGMALCVGCIFLGSAAENVMTNWISGYMENALRVSKTWGDILGMAMFALLIGSGRMLYAKYGRNISGVLLAGMVGSAVCYLAAGLSESVILAFGSCILTGIFVSMLWPGTLILMEEKMPNMGVAAYALMAAGGDFGASVAPQLMGIIVDAVSGSGFAAELSTALSLSTEQIGMKAGMITAAIFPIIGTVLLIIARKYFA
jgi:MFS family permease